MKPLFSQTGIVAMPLILLVTMGLIKNGILIGNGLIKVGKLILPY